MTFKTLVKSLAVAGVLLAQPFAAKAEENTLNLYSARHYSTDEALYDNFTKKQALQLNAWK